VSKSMCTNVSVVAWLCLASAAWGQVEVRDESSRLVLRNKQSMIVLDKEANGAILSLVDNSTGQEFIARDPMSCLFRLGFSKRGDASGKLIWLSSRDAETVDYAVKEEGRRKTAKLAFKKLGGRQLQAQCTVSVGSDDDLILWQFALEGPEPLILNEVQYPIVVLRAGLREEDANDAFLACDLSGRVYPRPSRWSVGTDVRHLQHPGSLTAQFGCYYDARCGFYSATQDSKGYPKRLHFRRTESGLEYVWQRYCYHDMSQRFDLGYAVAQTTFRSPDPALPTDWHDAADIYKVWALKQPWCARTLAQRDDVPGWLKEGPAATRFRRRHTHMPTVRLEHHHEWYSNLEHIEGWLKDYWQKHFPDVPLIAAFWGWERVSSWVGPKYFPPYPSEEGLRARVKAVRDAGGHPFFFPSGYYWTETFGKRADGTFEFDDREDFEKVGRPHAVMTRDGSPVAVEQPWSGGGTRRQLCRGDAWTRQWLNDTVVELTKRGADVIQIDQAMVGCGPEEKLGCCWSREHGHPPGPGLWFTEGFSEQLRTMRDATRGLKPDLLLDMEGTQELYIQQLGMQSYHPAGIYVHQGPWHPISSYAYAYLYHEFLCLYENNAEGYHGKPPGGNMLIMANSLVNGLLPQLVPHWPLQPSPALRNGGFEQWSGGAPDGWSRIVEPAGRKSAGLLRCDEEVRHGGKCSLRIENPNSDEVMRVAQTIGVGEYEREVGGHGPEVGKTYRLSLWFKAAELQKPGKVSIEAFDAEGEATGSWEIPVTRCDDWRRGEVAFTVPEHTARAQVVLQAAGACKVWFDDFVLEEPGEGSTYRVVMDKPILPAEHELGLQWVRLFHGEGRPYLLLGRMLRPPQLLTGRVKLPPTPVTGLRVPLHITDSKGTTIQTAPVNIGRDTDWVRRGVTFAVPEAAQRATLYLHLAQKGAFWFDDICLTEVGREENLIRNGDFEDWPDASAAPAGWTAAKRHSGAECKGRFYRDEEENRGGKFGIGLVNKEEGDIVQLSQSLPVDGKTLCKGKTYRLSLWMKVQGVRPLERELPAILHNAYRAPDGSEAVVAVNITDKPQTGKLSWHGKETEVKLSPWEARLIRKSGDSQKKVKTRP